MEPINPLRRNQAVLVCRGQWPIGDEGGFPDSHHRIADLLNEAGRDADGFRDQIGLHGAGTDRLPFTGNRKRRATDIEHGKVIGELENQRLLVGSVDVLGTSFAQKLEFVHLSSPP
ncbi:MAG: hypothetical protein UW95_C0023G0018 [Parcubacteria group bacterium GW2011_GWC1_45_14]|nr:MAG: hypothetical protein UW95_C0023G0018 [Parcubacteria group bacterium GW2011_GWC1_45_14]